VKELVFETVEKLSWFRQLSWYLH